MINNYFLKLIKMNYSELCFFLKNKYGLVKGNYFVNEKCSTKNKNITRTSEGLVIHHIDEDKYSDLQNSEVAKMYSFEFQKIERLLYCNFLEHLLLHFKIVLEHKYTDIELIEHNMGNFELGLGGIEYIVPTINDFFGGSINFKQWEFNCLNKISEYFDDYIYILKWFFQEYKKNGLSYIFEELLFYGLDGEIVNDIKNAYLK